MTRACKHPWIWMLILAAGFLCPFTLMAQPSGTLRLPPSLERELKMRGATSARVVRFSDTVKADRLISQSLRDSSATELDSTMVHDSAVITIDTAVSLSHKEWLDSMLTELPETEHTPEGLRFHYPDEMMISTARRPIPQDTSLPLKMDPVSKEDLPLFDALPIQRPLTPKPPSRFSFFIGGGTPMLPEGSATLLLSNGDHSSIEARASGMLRSGDATAITGKWDASVSSLFSFAAPTPDPTDARPLLSVTLGSSGLSREIDSSTLHPTYSLMNTIASFSSTFGSLEAAQMKLSGSVQFTSDNAGAGVSERSGAITAGLRHAESDSSNEWLLDLGYTGASTTTNVLQNNGALGMFSAVASIASARTSSFYWRAGVRAILTNDADDAHSYFFPSIEIGKQLTNDLRLSLSIDRSATVRSFAALYNENPFYAPLLSNDTLFLHDNRRVAVDNYTFGAQAEYYLSSDDYLSVHLGYSKRHNDVAFFGMLGSDSIVRFYPQALDDRCFTFDFSGELLFFRNDRFRFSAHFASTQSADSLEKQLPYVPTMKTDASYTFGTALEPLLPGVGVTAISTQTKNLFYLNAFASYRLDEHWSFKTTFDNILGTRADFWDGYNEHPLRMTVGIAGRF